MERAPAHDFPFPFAVTVGPAAQRGLSPPEAQLCPEGGPQGRSEGGCEPEEALTRAFPPHCQSRKEAGPRLSRLGGASTSDFVSGRGLVKENGNKMPMTKGRAGTILLRRLQPDTWDQVSQGTGGEKKVGQSPEQQNLPGAPHPELPQQEGVGPPLRQLEEDR